MVPLENRLKYIEKVSSLPKVEAFRKLIFSEDIRNIKSQSIASTDDIYYGCLAAISTSDKVEFDKLYTKLNRRIVNADDPAPYVHDNLLVFTLVVGVVKFSLKADWLRQLLTARKRTDVTITLENLLNSNYQSKSNIAALVVTFLDQIDSFQFTDGLLQDAYRSITSESQLLDSQDDLVILASLKAYDIVVLQKSPDNKELNFLQEFKRRFLSRTEAFAIVIYNLFLALIIFALYKLMHLNPEFKETLDEVGGVFGFLGVGLIGNFIPEIRSWAIVFTRKLLGYKAK